MTIHHGPESFGYESFLRAHQNKEVLRFIACGSVDDGKSTLIGRLLHDTKQIFDDQITALQRDSRRHGTQGAEIDLALLVDGLQAEREQGITIDVAYRFFSTETRSFIVADTPGHEQYTRNMATGASTADAAVVLVDVRKGLSRQTRRHSLLVSALGIRHVVLAVNKMDLLGWSEEVFARLDESYRTFAADLGFASVTAIPMSAKHGDNVTRRSPEMPWYRGPDLLTHLEELDVGSPDADGPFRLAVQWVNRPAADFRGFAGLVSGGPVRPGDRVVVLPSGERTRVARIVTFDGDLDLAVPGQAVTLTLADEVDVSRGAVIATADAPVRTTARLDIRLFWMAKEELRAGAAYLAKIGTQTVPVTVASVAARIDLDTLEPGPATTLNVNDVGDVTLAFDRLVPFDAFSADRDLGTLILIDRESFDTIGMGLVLAEAVPPAAVPFAGPGVVPRAAWSPEILHWLPRAFASPWRSALKIASWRVIGTVLTVGAAYLLTGSLAVALLLGAFEFTVKSVVQFGHERLWTHLGFGLRSWTPDAPQTSPRPHSRG